MVLAVGLEVISQVADALRQERDLDFRRPRVAFVRPVVLNQILLHLRRHNTFSLRHLGNGRRPLPRLISVAPRRFLSLSNGHLLSPTLHKPPRQCKTQQWEITPGVIFRRVPHFEAPAKPAPKCAVSHRKRIHRKSFALLVPTGTGPGPVRGPANQSPPHGIIVNVLHLLVKFPITHNVPVIAAAVLPKVCCTPRVPHAIKDCGIKRPPTGQHHGGKRTFQGSKEIRDSDGGKTRHNQQVKVLWHDHPRVKTKVPSGADSGQVLGKGNFDAVVAEKGQPAVAGTSQVSALSWLFVPLERSPDFRHGI